MAYRRRKKSFRRRARRSTRSVRRRPIRRKRRPRRRRASLPSMGPSHTVRFTEKLSWTYVNTGTGNYVQTFTPTTTTRLWDAFGSGVPTGFDEWSAFYNDYLVTQCTMSFRIVNTSEVITFGPYTSLIRLVLYATFNATPPVFPFAHAAELSRSKTILIPSTPGFNSKTISIHMNPARILGRGGYANDHQFVGQTDPSGAPDKQLYLHLLYQNVGNNTATNNNMSFQVFATARLTNIFRDRRLLPDS